MEAAFLICENAGMKPGRSDVEWIRIGLQEEGKTQSGLAKVLGRSPSAVTAMLKGERIVKDFEIPIIREYLGYGAAPPDDIHQDHADEGVEVVGIAGAGTDGSILYAHMQGSLGRAPSPRNRAKETVAVEVRGNSMAGIVPNGWYIYYDDVRRPPTPDLFGEICVVALSDGRVLVKELRPAKSKKLNRFDLLSVIGDPLPDVRLLWAARVTGALPNRSRRREP